MGDIDGTIKKGVMRTTIVMGVACLLIIIVTIVLGICLIW